MLGVSGEELANRGTLGSAEMRYPLIFSAVFPKLWSEKFGLRYDQTLAVLVCFGSRYSVQKLRHGIIRLPVAPGESWKCGNLPPWCEIAILLLY